MLKQLYIWFNPRDQSFHLGFLYSLVHLLNVWVLLIFNNFSPSDMLVSETLPELVIFENIFVVKWHLGWVWYFWVPVCLSNLLSSHYFIGYCSISLFPSWADFEVYRIRLCLFFICCWWNFSIYTIIIFLFILYYFSIYTILFDFIKQRIQIL